QLIADNALVIAEHHRDETVPEKVDGLARVRIQRYGDTVLSFFHRQE
ncbi:MAG: 16S rRNA (guanine(966)-N(2))-methyltransferase RsmD, partial [Firmicutes bacterium]|nr:16S rRNA (guanine(966)-N(2))-methyltransferase RsmD [Bacillota bacterium]